MFCRLHNSECPFVSVWRVERSAARDSRDSRTECCDCDCCLCCSVHCKLPRRHHAAAQCSQHLRRHQSRIDNHFKGRGKQTRSRREKCLSCAKLHCLHFVRLWKRKKYSFSYRSMLTCAVIWWLGGQMIWRPKIKFLFFKHKTALKFIPQKLNSSARIRKLETGKAAAAIQPELNMWTKDKIAEIWQESWGKLSFLTKIATWLPSKTARLPKSNTAVWSVCIKVITDCCLFWITLIWRNNTTFTLKRIHSRYLYMRRIKRLISEQTKYWSLRKIV